MRPGLESRVRLLCAGLEATTKWEMQVDALSKPGVFDSQQADSWQTVSPWDTLFQGNRLNLKNNMYTRARWSGGDYHQTPLRVISARARTLV